MSLTKFGRYEIRKEVGEGGMAQVYQAHDPNMDRLVALKIIRKNFSQDPRFHDRFWREAKTIANLEHRAIVPVHDFGSDEPTGQLYLVMRLMPDVLNKRLQREGVFSLEETSLILNRLAAALNAAHSRGIMHRDIKPANILLDDEGTVFLADFGLAAPIEKIESGMVPSNYGGSMFYMAPEQWLDKPLGQYTDVYQLGVTLFEMLTGERPFPEADTQILLDRHVNGYIPHACDLNPRLPSTIQPILEKAMAKEPSQRYQTVQELAEEVANLLRPKQIKRRYEIKEELQHGRFAVVYLAQDLVEDHRVALKIMKQPLMTNQIYRQLFRQQRKQVMDMPTHEALVPVYELDLHEERPFLAMKFVEGASLRERFRKERPLPIDKVCDIARQLAVALDVLHENKQVHGDINMGNVLLDANDNCVLTDFHGTAIAELTQSIQEQEAPLAYLPAMSPEQWAREPLVPQSDVYQFGLLLYELLCGQRPFTETSMVELQTAVEKEPPPQISSLNEALPHQFDRIFAKALAKQPDNRYEKASDLVQALNIAWQNHTFDVFKQQGESKYEAKNWEGAIEAYKQALEVKPNNKAVLAALERAERRKHDSGIFYQSRQAIESEQWQDAAYFLARASDTREKKEMLDLVQQKIQADQQYEAGCTAMQKQEWLIAQALLEETDLLEPNYKDVNLLLGELAEKIEGCLQQAREAIARAEYDQALSLLEPVIEHETAVALRQEIIQKKHHSQRARRRNFLGTKQILLGMGVALLIIVAVLVIPTLVNGLGFSPEACLATVEPRLRVQNDAADGTIINSGSSAGITNAHQTLDLMLELWPEDLSGNCHQFFEDEQVKILWESEKKNEVTLSQAGSSKWSATLHASQSFDGSDKIIVTLLYSNQHKDFTFQLNFE